MNKIQPGTICMLRSGGPLAVLFHCNDHGVATLIYHNSVTGLFEQFETPISTLREATTPPQVPGDVNNLRNTTVAKSSLS